MTRNRREGKHSRTRLSLPEKGASWVLVAPILLGLGLLALPGGAAAAEDQASTPPRAVGAAAPTLVRWKEIQTEASATRIRLETSAPPKYNLQVTVQPPQAEIEFLNAELAGLTPRVQVGDGTIDTVETRPTSTGGKILLGLAGPGSVDVVPWTGGIDLLVRLSTSPAPGTAATTSARLVTSLRSPDRLVFKLGAAPVNLSGFVLSDGKRLVVDAEGVAIPSDQIVEELADGPVSRVRIAKQDGRIRAVIESRETAALEEHRLEKSGDGFVVFLGRGAAADPKRAETTTMAMAAQAPAPAPEPAPVAVGGGSVSDLGFRQEGNKSLVEVVVSKAAPYVVREASAQRVVVDLLRTTLPDKFRRALDTSAFPGPVRLVAAYARTGKGKTTDTRIVVDLRKAAPYRVDHQGTKLTFVVEGGVPEPAVQGVAQVKREGQEVVVVEGKPGSIPANGAKAEPSAAKSGKDEPPSPVGGYTGRRLSMDFMDADIRNVLRLIGEVSGLNMVTGDDVQGKVTVRLVDVPWDQALEVILKTKGLDQVREGNVVRIAPADKLAAERARIRDAEKGAEDKAPLVSDIVSVNYATASELLDKVKAILTTRGSVAVDQRTNALLMKDVPEKIKEAKKLVARLDTPTPQVLIEARIVEVTSSASKDLGIQWGGKYSRDSAHGNATNWAFPNSVGLSGGTGNGDFAINLPSGGASSGALAISLGHVADIFSLDLRISALESSGQGRVVSSPRVSTLSNRAAEISQGFKIPFKTATQEKVETKEIEYLLKLNVLPQVTADQSIIMKINLIKDDADFSLTQDPSTPAKATRSASTEVIVKDGETTVIGGIINDKSSDKVVGIPFFSKIPWIGALFRQTVHSGDKSELVIFITPKIINPPPMVSNL